MEQALSDKLLQKTKFAHVAGEPTSLESLRKAGIGHAQAKPQAQNPRLNPERHARLESRGEVNSQTGPSMPAGWAPSAGVGCGGRLQPCQGEQGPLHVHRLVNLDQSRSAGMGSGKRGIMSSAEHVFNHACLLVLHPETSRSTASSRVCTHVSWGP